MYSGIKEMNELHEIRERHYNETKNMTDKEFIDNIHKEAQEAIKKYGLTFKVKAKQTA
jgi:hypothetical protein